jgi:hypothetical protein
LQKQLKKDIGPASHSKHYQVSLYLGFTIINSKKCLELKTAVICVNWLSALCTV